MCIPKNPSSIFPEGIHNLIGGGFGLFCPPPGGEASHRTRYSASIDSLKTASVDGEAFGRKLLAV
jgi:hypothetical protein